MANSQLESTETLVEQLVTDIIAAWPEIEHANVLSDHQESLDLPRASIELDVEMEPRSVRTVAQTHRFRIIKIWEFVRGTRLLTTKRESANSLIDYLMSGDIYAGVADSPMVTSVDLNPKDLEIDRRTEAAISIQFECVVEQDTTGAV